MNFLTYLRTQKHKTSDMIHYTSKEVNRNFKIKVSGLVDNEKVNTLVGFSDVNNDELAERLLDRAFNSTEDKCLCKLRRGIMISFYVA